MKNHRRRAILTSYALISSESGGARIPRRAVPPLRTWAKHEADYSMVSSFARVLNYRAVSSVVSK